MTKYQILKSRILNSIDPSTDEFWYKSPSMSTLRPYSEEEKEAMIKALEYAMDIINDEFDSTDK